MLFSEVKDVILEIKIKKVCLVQLGFVPTADSEVTLNENNQLDGVVTIKGISYLFSENKFMRAI